MNEYDEQLFDALIRELERGNLHHVNCCCKNPSECWSHNDNEKYAELLAKIKGKLRAEEVRDE